MIALLIHMFSALGTTTASAPVSESTTTSTPTIAAQGTRKSAILLLYFAFVDQSN